MVWIARSIQRLIESAVGHGAATYEDISIPACLCPMEIYVIERKHPLEGQLVNGGPKVVKNKLARGSAIIRSQHAVLAISCCWLPAQPAQPDPVILGT